MVSGHASPCGGGETAVRPDSWTSPGGDPQDYDRHTDGRIVACRKLALKGRGPKRNMDHRSRRRLLLTCPLFVGLPQAALDDILLQSTERLMRRGQTLYSRRVMKASYMGAVLSGRIRISATSAEGREVTLNDDRRRRGVRRNRPARWRALAAPMPPPSRTAI